MHLVSCVSERETAIQIKFRVLCIFFCHSKLFTNFILIEIIFIIMSVTYFSHFNACYSEAECWNLIKSYFIRWTPSRFHRHKTIQKNVNKWTDLIQSQMYMLFNGKCWLFRKGFVQFHLDVLHSLNMLLMCVCLCVFAWFFFRFQTTGDECMTAVEFIAEISLNCTLGVSAIQQIEYTAFDLCLELVTIVL